MFIPTGESQENTLFTTSNIVEFLIQLNSIENQIVENMGDNVFNFYSSLVNKVCLLVG
jgi:hypothetical protein